MEELAMMGEANVDLREIGTEEWLPFLHKPVTIGQALIFKRAIERNYRGIEVRVVPLMEAVAK